MGRPELPRFRADLNLPIELGAVDEDDAEARLERIVDELRPHLERAVRARRVGACEAIVTSITLGAPSAV